MYEYRYMCVFMYSFICLRMSVCIYICKHHLYLYLGGVFLPTTRGYHTANIVTLNNHFSLLVWGGLHRRGPTTKMEIFDLQTNTWRPESAQVHD
jgi:hypothetical protein